MSVPETDAAFNYQMLTDLQHNNPSEAMRIITTTLKSWISELEKLHSDACKLTLDPYYRSEECKKRALIFKQKIYALTWNVKEGLNGGTSVSDETFPGFISIANSIISIHGVDSAIATEYAMFVNLLCNLWKISNAATLEHGNFPGISIDHCLNLEQIMDTHGESISLIKLYTEILDSHSEYVYILARHGHGKSLMDRIMSIMEMRTISDVEIVQGCITGINRLIGPGPEMSDYAFEINISPTLLSLLRCYHDAWLHNCVWGTLANLILFNPQKLRLPMSYTQELKTHAQLSLALFPYNESIEESIREVLEDN
jgi:hypothetical protein